jgi:hypothetical protein
MKSVQLSELGALAEDVRNCETVAFCDGDEVIAKLVPNARKTLEERIHELVAQGKVRRGSGTLPDSFFTDPLPKFESESVLDQLLSDRHSRDY